MIRAAPTGMWVPRLAGGLEYAILGPPEAAPVVDRCSRRGVNRILWGEQGGSRAMQPPFQAYRKTLPQENHFHNNKRHRVWLVIR
jgi:hypothetical protein